MEHLKLPHLLRRQRVCSGLGFITVGMSAVIGTAQSIAETIHTKAVIFSSELHAPERMPALQHILEAQHTQIWVNLATAAISLGVGCSMAHDIEQLWSGPLYAGENAMPEARYPANVIAVDFKHKAA